MHKLFEVYMRTHSKIDVNETFYNENGDLKRLPSDFYYTKYAFDTYKFKKENGQFIIYIKFDYETDLQSFSTQIKSNKLDLLINMLELRDKLPKEIFENHNMTFFCDKFLNDSIANQIIKWCETNGFPYASDIDLFLNNSLKNKVQNIFENLKPTKYVSFIISDFIVQLNEIYSAFHMYRLINGFTDKIDFHLYTINPFSTSQQINFIDLKKYTDINEYKEIFESKYKNIKYENKISFVGEPHFIVQFQNLFDAAFYQLSLMLYHKEKELRICPVCHKYFEPKNSRVKYCGSPTCYPQKAYKRKKALEKKHKKNS